MTDKEAIVREFLAAWSDGDARKLADYFTEDAVFQMMPREAITGREPIHEDFKAQLAWVADCDFEITKIASAGDTVFTERVDRMKIANGNVELPVAGVFEVNDEGKLPGGTTST
jgi:limonene-1,2-epoxide hydrolase